MVRWKASNLGIPTAPATQGGAGLERNMHCHNIIVDSHLTSILGGQFVTDFGGKYGPWYRSEAGAGRSRGSLNVTVPLLFFPPPGSGRDQDQGTLPGPLKIQV